MCLPTNKDEDFLGREVTIAGWGTTRPFGFASDSLLKVRIPILNKLVCWESLARVANRLIPKGLKAEQICAGANGKDSYQGDSGGPMVLQRIKPNKKPACEHTLVGIVSYGHGCGNNGIYTRVSSFMDWIMTHIAPNM